MNEKATLGDMMEKVFLMGVGAATLTREAVQDIVDELVKRGQMTREQGQQIIDKAADRAVAETGSIRGKATEAYQDALHAAGVATQEHVEELERRISVLEAKVYGEPSRVAEPDTGFVATETEDPGGK
ncbi:MAG: phasin family protein [Thermoleophilia bacterium]